jgi:hypothetical protein
LKSFQFRLASVVRIRELQRRTEESKLEALLAQRARIESEMDEQQKSLDRSWISTKSQPTLFSADLAAMQSVEQQVKKDRAAFRNRLVAQDELILKQRAAVVEVRRKLRLLEKLRVKRHDEWEVEADRELAALVDDTTGARWMRRQN